MNEPFLLSSLRVGESACVSGLEMYGPMRRRLLDIGLTEGTPVTCLLRSPFGDPSAYEVRGAVFALRQEDSRQVRMVRRGVSWG
ncbi:MAG TPA: ferrous iron transport protein A [Candidatus Gallacutalibacter pullistercoris]|nr:ferrous iron transport protein A [Candidatus Gallacutalibacter pullistercoris]